MICPLQVHLQFNWPMILRMNCVLHKPVLQNVLCDAQKWFRHHETCGNIYSTPGMWPCLNPCRNLGLQWSFCQKSTCQNVLRYLRCATPNFILPHLKVSRTSRRIVVSLIQVSRSCPLKAICLSQTCILCTLLVWVFLFAMFFIITCHRNRLIPIIYDCASVHQIFSHGKNVVLKLP